MNPVLKNIMVLILGLIIGSAVNMGLITISNSVIPPPLGADISTMEGLKASIHLFQPKHFVFPFLAHALGTLTGAFFIAFFVNKHKIKWTLAVGVFFLIGGIINASMLPAPSWFIITDIFGAYIPMAFIAYKAVSKYRHR